MLLYVAAAKNHMVLKILSACCCWFFCAPLRVVTPSRVWFIPLWIWCPWWLLNPLEVIVAPMRVCYIPFWIWYLWCCALMGLDVPFVPYGFVMGCCPCLCCPLLVCICRPVTYSLHRVVTYPLLRAVTYSLLRAAYLSVAVTAYCCCWYFVLGVWIQWRLVNPLLFIFKLDVCSSFPHPTWGGMLRYISLEVICWYGDMLAYWHCDMLSL